MSDTHPRYIVAQGERLRFGEFILEYQVIDTGGQGHGRVVHLGFVEDDAAGIAEALNGHPEVERLQAEVRRLGEAREKQRQRTADEMQVLREMRDEALARLADIDPAPKVGK